MAACCGAQGCTSVPLRPLRTATGPAATARGGPRHDRWSCLGLRQAGSGVRLGQLHTAPGRASPSLHRPPPPDSLRGGSRCPAPCDAETASSRMIRTAGRGARTTHRPPCWGAAPPLAPHQMRAQVWGSRHRGGGPLHPIRMSPHPHDRPPRPFLAINEGDGTRGGRALAWPQWKNGVAACLAALPLLVGPVQPPPAGECCCCALMLPAERATAAGAAAASCCPCRRRCRQLLRPGLAPPSTTLAFSSGWHLTRRRAGLGPAARTPASCSPPTPPSDIGGDTFVCFPFGGRVWPKIWGIVGGGCPGGGACPRSQRQPCWGRGAAGRPPVSPDAATTPQPTRQSNLASPLAPPRPPWSWPCRTAHPLRAPLGCTGAQS